MFQSNAVKEVLYIFMWLAGIIFVYGLVHTFFLEPSNTTASNNHAKHAIVAKSSTHKETSTATNKATGEHTGANTVKTVSVPKVTSPVAVSKVPEVPKVKPMSIKTKEIAMPVNTLTTAAKVTAPIAVSKVPAIHTPTKSTTIPEVKTAKLNSIKKSLLEENIVNKPTQAVVKDIAEVSTPSAVSVPSLPIMPTIPAVPTVPSVPSVTKVEDMKLLDTAKQHVKAASTEIVNVLNK